MRPPGVETVCGAWTAQTGTVVTADGTSRVLVLNDGTNELVTGADPGELLGVLLAHLEVESIGPT